MAVAQSDQQLRSMVEKQVAARGVRNERVLAAMRRVPRFKFVPEHLGEAAHEDSPLTIACGQTISQPFIVALMAEAAEVGPDDSVLDIGTGSGYGAAVLSELADRVTTVEWHRELAEAARARLKRLGYDNVSVHQGDGRRGWPDAAPFDAIIVAATPQNVPEALKAQLAAGGRLVIPVGPSHHQRLLKFTRLESSGYRTEDLGAVAFVPLVSEAAGRPEREDAAGHEFASTPPAPPKV